MEEIQGGHCPCSKIQGGQPTTLPRLAARLVDEVAGAHVVDEVAGVQVVDQVA